MYPGLTLLRLWKLAACGFLKVNTDGLLLYFIDDKIGIDILIQNYLGISLFAKIIPHLGHFLVDYGELLGIIEWYMTESSID